MRLQHAQQLTEWKSGDFLTLVFVSAPMHSCIDPMQLRLLICGRNRVSPCAAVIAWDVFSGQGNLQLQRVLFVWSGVETSPPFQQSGRGQKQRRRRLQFPMRTAGRLHNTIGPAAQGNPQEVSQSQK